MRSHRDRILPFALITLAVILLASFAPAWAGSGQGGGDGGGQNGGDVGDVGHGGTSGGDIGDVGHSGTIRAVSQPRPLFLLVAGAAAYGLVLARRHFKNRARR